MIQAPQPGGLHYAVQMGRGVAAGARLPREAQSAAAATLLANLRERTGIVAGWSSKSHARALCAAALSGSGKVGIDVEFEAPDRDICAIARWLVQGPVADEATAYRLFTFREAYFKASGELPSRDLLRVAAEGDGARRRTPDGFDMLHEAPVDGFVLTLVWRGGAAPVRHELP